MSKCLVVAELGINCNGDLKIAEKLIDIAKFAGCDYVKFQKRDINLVYSQEELDKYRESPFGTTNRQQKEGLEFNRSEYRDIDTYCRMKDTQWFASPWDINSVKFLNEFKTPYMKVASALVTNIPVLEEIKKTNTPVISLFNFFFR